ncbi:IclR family transcriptional regulator [Amphritea sp. 2_MG-2023]|uniref:IclR family transcriptional regulator n=1 Tax=Amphritea TaxID=515417 RepID=UPI0020912C81|nr:MULTISPECIES: IclR family transcriptional regulator [Amphritea]MDO6419977.1 IclR family transcriptional regulator [Amphritea sp. 2_MG-2023]MDX2422250.1 IclR family transcriptional regulator [Amphritea sp.]
MSDHSMASSVDENTATKPISRIQVIDRAAHILDAISRYSQPVTLKVLSAETGLHPSTAHRILRSLIDNRFVDRNENGEYWLGNRLLQLTNKRRTDVDLRAVALPYMERLRDQLGESINLTIREGDVVIYFERAIPNRMMHVHQLVGSRAPLHVTGVGKLMLGIGGETDIISYAQRTNLPTYTQNTFSTLPELMAECRQSATQGYALDNEEAEIGVGCIGVLIYDQTQLPVAGLSISAPIERRQLEWIDALKEAANAISAQLGYTAHD